VTVPDGDDISRRRRDGAGPDCDCIAPRRGNPTVWN
jgi:hypothetical protein